MRDVINALIQWGHVVEILPEGDELRNKASMVPLKKILVNPVTLSTQ
jgi:hypothetical protein